MAFAGPGLAGASVPVPEPAVGSAAATSAAPLRVGVVIVPARASGLATLRSALLALRLGELAVELAALGLSSTIVGVPETTLPS